MSNQFVDVDKRLALVFDILHIDSPKLLGKGGEGSVYEFGADALKIYPRNTDIDYLHNIQRFLNDLRTHNFTFDIPQIYEVGNVEGVLYTVEKRLHGTQMDKLIVGMDTTDRQKCYASYYEAIKEINAVTYPDLPFGQILKSNECITAPTWAEFLVATLDQKMVKTRETLLSKVSDLDGKVNRYKSLIRHYLQSNQRNLVHSDYYLNNVLVGNNLKISAVLDFSLHACVGDPRLDIAGVLTWNGIDSNIHFEDYSFLYDRAKQDYGEGMSMIANLYLLFSSFYFSDMEDPSFSIKNLNDTDLWNSLWIK